MVDRFSDTSQYGQSDRLSMLGVQSILIHRSHVTAARVAMYQYQHLLLLIA